MRLAGKTGIFLFLFVIVSILYADPFPGEELLFDDDLFFFEEFFIFEEFFSFEPDEPEPGSDNAAASTIGDTAETGISDAVPSGLFESSPLDESSMAEETFLDDDSIVYEAPALVIEAPVFEMRSFAAIFPYLSRGQRIMAMNDGGLRNYISVNETPMLTPNPDFGIDLLGSVMEKNPSHLVEALVVVPYNERELDFLDIYNALGRIEKIKDYPVLVNEKDFYIFTESTRIESSSNRRAILDPLPAVNLPFSETIYLRLKEETFGNIFIRGDISINVYGITYSMTNFTDVRFFLVPIMRAERFITIIYLEPVREGLLIYCMCGFYLPGFIADRVNLTANVNRRIEVFLKWIIDGLRIQESASTE